MRRHVLNALAALAAVTALTVSGCSSGAAKPSAAGSQGSSGSPASSGSPGASTPGDTASSPDAPDTPDSSPSVDAFCLRYIAGSDKQVTHFPGGNDHTVEAYTTGEGPVGIVLAHQVGGDLCQWQPAWKDFPAADYTVMSITMGGGIDTDVAKAVEQLRARGLKKIVLVGASMGGTAVLAAAGEISPPVQGVVSLSGPSDYGPADALAAVKTFQVPVSYFAAGKDTEFATDAQTMFDATTEKDKALKIVADSSDHGVQLWPEVRPDVFAFIKQHTK
ncbi:MAG: alpha/beta hydrolase [Catenulispora sp.]|nr:alpha/beta hydrolase [Catenulispora sp.]